MNILITGSNGFIGKNLKFFLKEKKKFKIIEHTKKDSITSLKKKLRKVDFILHFAGENISKNKNDFKKNNVNLVKIICQSLEKFKLKTPVIFSSSIQVKKNNNYGVSKKKCEDILIKFKNKNNSIINILRLPNIFGKWSKPNYNSAVATFCFNLSRNIEIKVNRYSAKISLLYIDDLILQIYQLIKFPVNKTFPNIKSTKVTTLQNLVKNINLIKDKRETSEISHLKNNFIKNLYSTYISFLPLKAFQYNLIKKEDKRGEFLEFAKFKQLGQISYFTINPKEERGHHYHHSKVEKFLLLTGKVKCYFKNINNNTIHSFETSEKNNRIFESIPGWAHVIKNNTNKKAIILVWSNEVFKKEKPDTYKYKIDVKN